jgi:hemoglobin
MAQENQTPYQLLGGEQAVRDLADAFYEAMDELPQAETVRAMHAKSLGKMKGILFEYLSGWMGGPPIYHDKHGTVCMTKPHEPFAIGPAERDAWLLCMDKALVTINASNEVIEMLKTPMYRIANAIKNCEDSSESARGGADIIAVS